LRRVVRSAGLEPPDLDAVLLVGGSSRVPLVAQLVSAELGRPIAVDADPQAAIALGAALSALPADRYLFPEISETADTDIALGRSGRAATAHTFNSATLEAQAASVQVPPRPSSSAKPLDLAPAHSPWQPNGSRWIKQAAGLLALAVAGIGVAVLVLASQPASTAPAAAGLSPPDKSVTATSTVDTGNTTLPNVGPANSTGAVRPASSGTPKRASGDTAHSAAAVPTPQIIPARPDSGTAKQSVAASSPAASASPSLIATTSPSPSPTEPTATATDAPPPTTTSEHPPS
jgi:molecular chaperone DnaK